MTKIFFEMNVLEHLSLIEVFNLILQTTILMELYCASRSEKYFQDPLELKPERWLRENESENHAFSNLSFGFGARMCVGRNGCHSLEVWEVFNYIRVFGVSEIRHTLLLSLWFRMGVWREGAQIENRKLSSYWFKGKTITQNCMNMSFLFLFCTWKV